MAGFACPVCGGDLEDWMEGKSLRCSKGHSFDRAKSGYVNLLRSQSSRQHGDDGEMVRARYDFLERGYYLPLLDRLAELLLPLCPPKPVLLDAGCGECWYTAGLAGRLREAGRAPRLLGVDLSKQALRLGNRRDPSLALAVATVARLPVGTRSCDGVLSLFAPLAPAEFARVLKGESFLIRVHPLEEHLWSLKQAVYDRPVPNPPERDALEGFRLEQAEDLRREIRLSSQADIHNLFAMTPYAHKTGPKDRGKLEKLERLSTETAFGIRIYRKE